MAWLARVIAHNTASDEVQLQHFEQVPGVVDGLAKGTVYAKNTGPDGVWSEHRSCTWLPLGGHLAVPCTYLHHACRYHAPAHPRSLCLSS